MEHCACGCKAALKDGTPTGECSCWLTHPQFMFTPGDLDVQRVNDLLDRIDKQLSLF